jgi:hypothetical protein
VGLGSNIFGEWFMKAVEFCYWLQGYYEISGSALMSPNQLTIVRRHLDMVAIHEKGDGRSVQFCTELRQLLSNGSYFGLAPQLPAETLRAVAKKLNEVFLHEIDPSYPVSEQAPLNNAHFLGANWNDEQGSVAKC